MFCMHSRKQYFFQKKTNLWINAGRQREEWETSTKFHVIFTEKICFHIYWHNSAELISSTLLIDERSNKQTTGDSSTVSIMSSVIKGLCVCSVHTRVLCVLPQKCPEEGLTEPLCARKKSHKPMRQVRPPPSLPQTHFAGIHPTELTSCQVSGARRRLPLPSEELTRQKKITLTEELTSQLWTDLLQRRVAAIIPLTGKTSTSTHTHTHHLFTVPVFPHF